MGDSLRRSIDRGLAESRYGVVVLSPAFFAKEYPQNELDGLASREFAGQKVILPIWHNVGVEEVLRYSPMLAGRISASSAKGIAYVVSEILNVLSSSAVEPSATKSQEDADRTNDQLRAFRAPQTVAELVVLLKWLLHQVNSLEVVSNTFGRTGRIHENLWALRPRAIAAIHACKNLSAQDKTELAEFLERGAFDMFLREADLTLPRLGEKHYSGDRTLLKRDKFQVQGILESSIERLLRQYDSNTEYLQLMADPSSWRLRGFRSEQDYAEYLHPTTVTLFRNLTPLQREMLLEVLSLKKFTEDDLARLGVPSAVIAETLNSLIRDSWLRVLDFDTGRFVITELGARLLRNKLSST